MSSRADARRYQNRRVMRRVFERLVRRTYPPGTRLTGLAVREIGHYRFKHALRYDLSLSGPGNDRMRVLVRGNVPSNDTKREVAVADRLQRSVTRAGFAFGKLRAPVSFGIVPSLRLNLYEEVPGTTLERLLRKRNAAAVRLAGSAGEWIAAFHRAKFMASPVRTSARIRAEVGFFRDDAWAHAPGRAGEIIRLLVAVQAAQQDVIRRYRNSFCSIHGDLNLGNAIAVPDGSTAFIDFGNSWQFDPLSDIGNFLAQVDLAAWRSRSTRAFAGKIGTAFLRSYWKGIPASARDRQKRIDLHRAWWSIQILSYYLSTNQALGWRILRPALASARRLLKRWGYDTPGPLDRTPLRRFRRTLLNSEMMRSFFADNLLAFFPGIIKVERVSVSHPHALSQTSFLTRYELSLRTPNNRVIRRVVRGNAVDACTAGILDTVYRRQSDDFRTMRPLVYLKRHGYLFYEELPGTPLRAIPFRSATLMRLMPIIARGLLGLHRASARGVRELSWAGELRALTTMERRIHSRSGQSLKNISSAISHLRSAERPLWRQRRALVHNDFQASNILWSEKGLGIIDFTQSGIGHPGIDLGNFLAHLGVMLYRVLPQGAIKRLQNRFETTYLAGLPHRRRERFRQSVVVFQLRSAVDIAATTLVNLGPRDPNRRKYAALLDRECGRLLREVRGQ